MSFEDTINFLAKKVREYESSLTKRKLIIPRKTCGTIYSISFLRRDQRHVMAVVIHNLSQWLGGQTYFPLRMTISGVARSGKSTLIQTIVATVRNIFQRNDVVYVSAPTGSAAFSAGGETLHRLFGIRVNMVTETLKPAHKKRLLAKFANIVVLIVDERSMLQSDVGNWSQWGQLP